MANALTNVVPQILAQGIQVLRQNSVMPRVVNRSLEANVANYGDTIDVPYVGEATAVTVAPGPIYTNTDITAYKVQVPLNFWRQAAFNLSDKEIEEAIGGTMPMRANATIKALANAVDSYILALYKGVYSARGVAGTTPFASTVTAYLDARKLMNSLNAPVNDRSVILGSDAEGNALGLPLFSQANFRGDQQGVINGKLGFLIGADWQLDQNVPTHSAGTTTAEATMISVASYAIGATSIQLRGSAPAGTLVTGDLFTIGAGTQQYVVSTTCTVTGTLVTVTFDPPLVSLIATAVTAAFVATHVVNLLLHRDAIAWASRPMSRSSGMSLGPIFETVVDPISGLALRLEVSRQNKQTTWVWDILGGGALIRPQLACRIMG